MVSMKSPLAGTPYSNIGRKRCKASGVGNDPGDIRRTIMLIVVGSRNRKKLEEIIEIIGDLQSEGLEFADLSPYPQAPEVVEDGTTFEANSRKKASELARTLNEWVMAHASALVLPPLHTPP